MSARDALKAQIVAARTPAALAGLAIELRQLADELDAQSGAAAADYYTTVRDEIKGFAQTYW